MNKKSSRVLLFCRGAHIHARVQVCQCRVHARIMILHPHFKILCILVGRFLPERRAMDARTQKRVAQIAHIKQKAYYEKVHDEPDPFRDREMSTRMWKYTVRVWIQSLKNRSKDVAGQPRHQDGASLAVMGGS